MSGPGAPKHARDEAEPEFVKRLKGEGSDVPRAAGDVTQDDDCAFLQVVEGLMGRHRLW